MGKAIYSKNSDISSVLKKSLRQYDWLYPEPGSKHARVRSHRSRDYVTIPFSPSDWRSVRGFEAQIRRFAERSQGTIFARTGKFANESTLAANSLEIGWK